MNAKELIIEVCDDLVKMQIEQDWLNFDFHIEKLRQLIPTYRQPQPSDDGKWCYLEELPDDAPPTLVRSVPCLGEVDPSEFEYWTVAGWRELTKGVWPCERPERGA